MGYMILENQFAASQENKKSELDGIQQQIQKFMVQSALQQRQTSIEIQQLQSQQSSQEPVSDSIAQSEMETIKNENSKTKQALAASQTELKATEQQFHFWKNKAINYQNELKLAEAQCNELSASFDKSMADQEKSQRFGTCI